MDFSREELEKEISEMQKDLASFVSARDIIRNRVLEVRDAPRCLTTLPEWSGTDAVLGSLDLSIHAMERTIDELEALLTNSKPRLRLVPTEELNED